MSKSCNSSSPKATDGKHVCNTKTGFWVLKSSKIGQQLTQNKSPTPKIVKKKSLSPKVVVTNVML